MPERSSRHVCKGGQGEREEINGILRKERGRVMMMMMIRSSRNIRAIEKIQLLYTFLFVYCRGGGQWGLKKHGRVAMSVSVLIHPSIRTQEVRPSVAWFILCAFIWLLYVRKKAKKKEKKDEKTTDQKGKKDGVCAFTWVSSKANDWLTDVRVTKQRKTWHSIENRIFLDYTQKRKKKKGKKCYLIFLFFIIIFTMQIILRLNCLCGWLRDRILWPPI